MYRKIQSGGGEISLRAVCRTARSGARTTICRPAYRAAVSVIALGRIRRSPVPFRSTAEKRMKPQSAAAPYPQNSAARDFLKKALTRRKICDIIYELIRRQQVTVKAKAILPRRRKRTHKSVTLSSGSERELFLSSVTNFSKEEKTNAQSESIGTEGCRS